MKFSKATPEERAALIRMVSASVRLVVVAGRAIKEGQAILWPMIDAASEEFANACIKVSEAESAADRESFR